MLVRIQRNWITCTRWLLGIHTDSSSLEKALPVSLKTINKTKIHLIYALSTAVLNIFLQKNLYMLILNSVAQLYHRILLNNKKTNSLIKKWLKDLNISPKKINKSPKACKKMLKITDHQGNTHQNYSETPPHTS